MSRAASSRAHGGVPWVASLMAIAVAALALRVAHLLSMQGTPLFSVLIGDAREYDAWAQRMAGGAWLGTDVFYQTPLYPYLLAIVFKIVGHHVLAVRVLQALSGAVSCVLLGMAGRSFFNARTGLVAAGLLAIYPPAIFFDGLIQKSALDVLLVTLLLASLGAFHERRRTSALVLAGVALGAFMLNRENARVIYPIVLLWLLVFFRDMAWRRRLVQAGVFTAVIGVVVLPVAARNYAVGGEWMISTSQFGPNLYIGNHIGASGTYDALVPGHGNAAHERADATQLAEQAEGRALSPGDVSRYWTRRALADIRSRPSSWLALTGRKMWLTLQANEIADTESIGAYAEYSVVLRALRWMSFGVIFPLAVLGAWLARAEWRRSSLLVAMFIGLVVSIALFYVVARYRYPIVPIAMLFAAAALADMPAMLRSRRLAVPAAILVLAGIVSNVPVAAAPDATVLNVASVLIDEGRAPDAIPLLTQAVRASAGDPALHFQLGVACDKARDASCALAEFAEAVRLQPDWYEARNALALAQIEAGRADEALGHWREAVRIRPGSAGAHNNLAMALQQRGALPDAIAEYTAALRIDASNALAESNLALALTGVNRADEALPHFAAAVRLQPSMPEVRFNYADALLAHGRKAEALEQYERAGALAPARVDAQFRLANAYAETGRLADAVRVLDTALALARSQGDAQATRQITGVLGVLRARTAQGR